MMVLFIAAGWLIISLIAAIWVLLDAQRRGSSGALWFVIVLILGLLGFAVWMVVRPSMAQPPPLP